MIRRTIESLGKITKYVREMANSAPPRLIYVSGSHGYPVKNLGDEALFEAYKALFGGFDLVHYPGGRVLSIPSKVFRLSGYAVLAGGTLINRWGLTAFQECADIFPRLFVFGTGVAQPSFWSAQSGWKDTMKQWKCVLEKCDYVGVRGPLSAELLVDQGIDNVEVIGDPVLVFAAENYPDRNSYEPNSIGLNLGQSLGNVWGSQDSICAEYVRLATLARDEGWKVSWFVVWPNDLSVTEKAAALSGTADHIYKIYQDYRSYHELVKRVSVFVGMKLHSVILATCAYVPSIMLGYRPKCLDYMMSIGQEQDAIRTDKFRAEEVWDRVISKHASRDELSQTLYRSIKPMKDKQLLRAEGLMKRFTLSR